MKKIYFLNCVFVLLALGAQAQFTDVNNNGINYEFTIEYNHYFNASSESGNSEPVIQTDIWISSFGWIGYACHNWSCEPSCYDGGGDNIWWGGGTGFDAEWSAYMLSYESDNSNECVWTEGDDDDWQGYGVLRAGQQQQRIIYESSDFRPCQIINSLGNGGTGWLFPDNPHFNQILQLKWRYQAGDSPGDALNFGTIGGNQTKSDINSNRAISSVGNFVPLEYTHSNNSEYASADVWYKFTINEPRQVTIRTNHGETDFDTFLKLWTESGNYIAEDDQSGGNNTSLINTTLCAGTYSLLVEGWNSSTGIFKVSVEVGDPVAGVSTGVSSSGTSCQGVFDGYVEWNPTGGIPPYDWTWQGADIPANFMSGLNTGSYSLVVTDACGTTSSETVVINVADNTPPNAQCTGSFDIALVQGQTAQLLASEIDNGSTDDCGIGSMSISPSSFSVNDTGSNTVTLTVIDENGNSSTCQTTVNVVNTTGIEEAQLAKSIAIYPNPNDGSFVVDLTEIDLEQDAIMTLLDITGREVWNQNVTRSMINVEINDASRGIYILRLDNNGLQVSKRISVIK